MTKPIIPFGWMPGHWGLRGTTREIAKAEYELSGMELEMRLAEIRISDDKELKRELLAIHRRHDRITTEQFEDRMTDLADFEDENKKTLAKLDLDLKYKRITQEKYDRAKADMLGEPWVSMPRIHWSPLGKPRAFFELDYNEHFVKQLRDNGYSGDDTEIVNQWMNDVCEGILEESPTDDLGSRRWSDDPT